MIAVTSSGRRFAALARYLVHGRSGEETERVAWTAGRNLGTDDPEIAAALMQATANQNARVEAPVYHLTISFDPTDAVTPAQMQAVADRVLADLGLAERQALLVAHQDRAHRHVHIMVNRVHPETGRAWELWQDRPRIEHTLRELEREFGLREVAGRLYQLEGQEPPEPALLTTGERREAERTGEPAFPERVREHLAELRAARSWAELEERLAAHSLRLERKGQGLVITDGEHQVKASRVARDLSLRRLEGRFGVPFPGREKEQALREPLSPDVAQLKPALEEYERVAALPGQQYHAEMDLSGAQARLRGLDWEIERLPKENEDFDRALAKVYRDPIAAREQFQRAVADVGPERAATRLRTEPERFGALLTVERPRALGLLIVDDPTQARGHAPYAASSGEQLANTEARIAQAVGAPARGTALVAAVERARALLSEQLEQAHTRVDRLREEARQAPRREVLEHSIARVVARLEPRQLVQLRLLVTAPQAALALQARGVLKDLLLGRAEEREA